MAIERSSIEKISRKWSSGMSPEQMNMYVINSHVTKDRQIKQALLECENRFHNLEKLRIERKKHAVKYKQIQKQLEVTTDEYERELLLLDLEDMDLDFNVFERREKTVEKELETFIEYLQSLDIDEEELEKRLEYDSTEERKYWIARMGKQAALDILTSGRIGSGNLDSIAMMTEEDQLAIFEVAIQYSALMRVSLNKIEGKLSPYLKQLESSAGSALPTFHGIEENFEVPLLKQLKTVRGELNASTSSTPSLQLAYKPEAS